jgi:hypothetical protein
MREGKEELLLRRHLRIGVAPRAELETPAHPAKPFIRVRGALFTADRARCRSLLLPRTFQRCDRDWFDQCFPNRTLGRLRHTGRGTLASHSPTISGSPVSSQYVRDREHERRGIPSSSRGDRWSFVRNSTRCAWYWGGIRILAREIPCRRYGFPCLTTAYQPMLRFWRSRQLSSRLGEIYVPTRVSGCGHLVLCCR